MSFRSKRAQKVSANNNIVHADVMMTIVIGQHRYDLKLQCPEYSYTVPKC